MDLRSSEARLDRMRLAPAPMRLHCSSFRLAVVAADAADKILGARSRANEPASAQIEFRLIKPIIFLH